MIICWLHSLIIKWPLLFTSKAATFYRMPIPTCFSIGQFVAWRPWGVVGWIVRCPLLLQRFLFDLDLDLWLDCGAVEFCAHFIGRLWQHFCGWRGRPSFRCPHAVLPITLQFPVLNQVPYVPENSHQNKDMCEYVYGQFFFLYLQDEI